MSFRTVVISSKCKLNYKNDHLYVRGDELKLIHLSEIEILIIESTQVLITSYLLCELIKRKIYVVFCNEKHNPDSQLLSLYGCHNSSKKLKQQLAWTELIKDLVWTSIVSEKIRKQSEFLKSKNMEEYKLLEEYYKGIESKDTTNREGHAAKVYFNALFGKEFTRDDYSDINKALDYGYTILLSFFNREIVANGYLTQLGLWHRCEFNQFNLSSDLMEPFRILVDELVYKKHEYQFNSQYKHELVNIFNKKITIDKKTQYVSNAIKVYVKSIFKSLESDSVNYIKFYEGRF